MFLVPGLDGWLPWSAMFSPSCNLHAVPCGRILESSPSWMCLCFFGLASIISWISSILLNIQVIFFLKCSNLLWRCAVIAVWPILISNVGFLVNMAWSAWNYEVIISFYDGVAILGNRFVSLNVKCFGRCNAVHDLIAEFDGWRCHGWGMSSASWG